MGKKSNKSTSELTLRDAGALTHIYNLLMFGDAYETTRDPTELFEELEARGQSPIVCTEKALIRVLLRASNEVDDSNQKVTLKELKEILAKEEKSGRIKRLKNHPVTELFLEVQKVAKKRKTELDVELQRTPEETKAENEKPVDLEIACPYCSEQIEITHQDEAVQCTECEKEIRCLSGQVERREGSLTRTASYGPPAFTLRLKTIKGPSNLHYRTNILFTVNKGDAITAVYKKGFLSGDWKLARITNWTTGEYCDKVI